MSSGGGLESVTVGVSSSLAPINCRIPQRHFDPGRLVTNESDSKIGSINALLLDGIRKDNREKWK